MSSSSSETRRALGVTFPRFRADELGNEGKDPEDTHHNWVMAGQRTSAALTAKGYHHRFVFSKGTGHCDKRVFELTLADALVWVWRGYHAE